MKKQALFWSVAIVLIAVFSVLLAGAVQNTVLQPVIKFFWLLKGYYGSIDQAILWLAVVAVVLLAAGLSLRGATLHLGVREAHKSKSLGEVAQLSYWIRRSKQSIYSRWYLARTLANLALELLRGRGADVERGGLLRGPEWDPPGKIRAYLETAMQSTPATFAGQLQSAGVENDPEAETIVEYLETYAENFHD